MSLHPIVNIDTLELTPRREAFAATGAAAERFDARSACIGPRIGARLLGYKHHRRAARQSRLPPGASRA